MKNVLLAIALLSCTFYMHAQNVSRIQIIEQFYNNYFDLCTTNDARLDSLVDSNCTTAFAKAWKFDVKEKGLYDPLTNGHCEDYNMMKNTLCIQEENGHYIVSFNYLTWPENSTRTERVIIFLDTEGHICRTIRPSDGYATPDSL